MMTDHVFWTPDAATAVINWEIPKTNFLPYMFLCVGGEFSNLFIFFFQFIFFTIWTHVFFFFFMWIGILRNWKNKLKRRKTLKLFPRCKNCWESCVYRSKVLISANPCSTQPTLVLPKLMCLNKLPFIWIALEHIKNACSFHLV